MNNQSVLQVNECGSYESLSQLIRMNARDAESCATLQRNFDIDSHSATSEAISEAWPASSENNCIGKA